MIFIKFCGMTREADVEAAVALGVDAVGLIFWPGSPRYIAPRRAAALVALLPETVTPVGVFVRPTADEIRAARTEAGITVAQIHEDSGADARALGCTVWVATSLERGIPAVPDADATLVLDAHDPARHGGTGRTIDWERAAEVAARRRVILAGGLTAANVAAAVRQVRPFGVDVASGIEDAPGIKNHELMQAFVAAVGPREGQRAARERQAG